MKKYLLFIILFLVVGFATVSTVLVINGNIRIGFNEDDFNIIFSDAKLDGNDVYELIVSEDHKSLDFVTRELKTVNESSVLEYEIYNASTQYDADVVIECTESNKYLNIVNSIHETNIGAKATLTGTLTLTMMASTTEARNYSIECTINASPTENIVKATPTLTPITLDAQGGVLENANYGVELLNTYSNLPIPTKPGYGFLGWYDSLENGLVVTSNTVFTHTSPTTLYAKYEPGRYTVIFNPDGGHVSINSKSVSYDSVYGELPTATKDNYTFVGWYTAVTGGSLVTSTSRVNSTSDTTLYARFVPETSMAISNTNGDYVQIGTRKFTLGEHNDVVLLRMYSKDDKTLGGYAIAAKNESDLNGQGNSSAANLAIYSYQVNGKTIYIGYLKTGFSIKGSDPVTAVVNGNTKTISTWYDETNDTLLEYLSAILYK